MNNEKDFYDILRAKFNNSEIPFSDEENWKSMRKMIDDSRKARDRALWLFTSLGLLLCAGGAFAIYEWTSTGGKTKTPSANYSSLNKEINSETSSNAPISGSKTNIATSISNSGGNNNQGSSLNNQTVQLNNNTGFIAGNNTLHQNSEIKKSSHLISSYPGIVAGNAPYSNTNKNANFVDENDKLAITGSSQAGNGSEVTNSKEVPAVSNNAVLKTNTSLEVASHKTDSASNGDGLPLRFSDEPRIFRNKKNFISLDAGVSWSGGWDYGSTTQGHGFYPVLGVGYMHYLKSKLFVKTGIQFSIFDNMNSIPYINEHQTGNLATYSVITTQNLFYLTVPIQFEWYLGNKNAVGFGGSISRLLGSSSSGSTYQRFDNNPPINVQPMSHIATLNGYMSWNTSIYIFYKWNISRKFSMYIMPYYGLTDIKNNSFFGTNLFERDKGIKILLSYNL